MAAARGEHGEATRQYQDALDAIASPSLTPTEPPDEVIARIFSQAQTSRLLAPDYVPTTRNTRGEPGGLAAPAIRSFGVTRVALPIQFHFDSNEFTEAGAAAAADLADYLRVQGDGPITLIGHADPVGNAEYNRRLSLRRAEAVRDYLATQGLTVPIRVEGRGHDEPFQPATEAELTRDQIHQMHRRVELNRD
ncbi:MAG: OmpA family protein [Pararhodobacter sp.]|nr:OmpA family protein [Pararhodobacter sp.]